MTDGGEDGPRPLASRKISWPSFAIAFSALTAGFFGAVEEFFANLITIFGMHLNYQYEKDDQESENSPHIRTE